MKFLSKGHNYLCFLSVYRISVRTGTVGKTDKKNRQEKQTRKKGAEAFGVEKVKICP